MLQSLIHLCEHLHQYVDVFLVLGSPELDTALQMCLTSGKQRRRITSIDLLVVFFLMQLSMLLAFFAVREHC